MNLLYLVRNIDMRYVCIGVLCSGLLLAVIVFVLCLCQVADDADERMGLK